MKTRCHAANGRPFALSLFATAIGLTAVGCGGGYGGGGGGNGTPPYITTQPTNQTVTAPQTATFSVVASGTAPLSYQWQKNGANVSGATASSYTTPATKTSDNGSTFKVVVSNTAGSVTSNAATLTVNPATGAPAISSLSPASGAVGTPVTIAGSNFGATQGSSTVTFNGTAATPASWSATSIATPVPVGATTGAVIVTVAGVASNGMTFTVSGSTGSQFPIKLSTNKRYFVDGNGNPWLMVADAGHHLMAGLPQSSLSQYLNDRKNNGFNTINFYGACGESGTSASSGTCQASGAAYDGTLPFTVGTSNANYDLSSPNKNYWPEVDNVINQANSLGLVVLFDPLPWGVNFGTAMENTVSPVNYVSCGEPIILPCTSNDYNFGVYLGNRYKSFPNIIWQFGQDFRHNVLPDATFMDYMAQVMAGVASVDKNHLITAQMNYNRSYTQQAFSIGNASFNSTVNTSFVYTYYETYDAVLAAYNDASIMPAFLGESNYETANNTGLLSSNANAFITRMEMWYTMTSGGAGHEFGNEHVNHFDPSWQSSLDTTATLQVKYLTNLFSQFQWWRLVPDQNHQVVMVSGSYNASNGNLYTATYVTAAWNPNGTLAIAYTPVSTTALTVNMAKFTKTMTASWYDPTTGNSMPLGSFVNTGTQTFTTPSGTHTDGTGANDWVLVLQ